MKVMQRGIMKILPGKMIDAMELNEEYMAMVKRLGAPIADMRTYRPWFGGEYIHAIVFEMEWESLTAMAAFFEKMMAEPKMQTMMNKWETLLESHEVEIYTIMS